MGSVWNSARHTAQKMFAVFSTVIITRLPLLSPRSHKSICHAPTQVLTSPYTSVFPFTALPNLVNGSAIPSIDKTKSLNPIHQQVC